MSSSSKWTSLNQSTLSCRFVKEHKRERGKLCRIDKKLFCLINKKLFQETLYDAKLKPSEEGLEETLEVTMKQVIMMMTVGALNIDAGIIYFTIMKSFCTL